MAEADYNVLVIEKESLGRDKACAGGITIRTFEKLDIDMGDFVEREIRGLRMYSPDNSILKYDYGKVAGVTVYRNKFDSYLSNSAINAGAEFLTNTVAKNILKKNNSYELFVEKNNSFQKKSGKMIIAANGVLSNISEQAGLHNYSKNDVSICAQYEMEMNEKIIDNLIGDNVELYFGDFAPGGYGWIFPKKRGVTAGVAIAKPKRKKKMSEYLDMFVKKHPITSNKLKNAKVLNKTGGLIPMNGVIGKTYSDNFLVVGDAAGQVSPLTWEGIYYSMISAKNAADVSMEAISENNFSNNKLKKYENQWKKEIGADLKLGVILRNFLLAEENRINFLVNEANNNERLKVMIADLILGSAPYKEILKNNYSNALSFLFKDLMKKIYF